MEALVEAVEDAVGVGLDLRYKIRVDFVGALALIYILDLISRSDSHMFDIHTM
jgi:hypothetical protein